MNRDLTDLDIAQLISIFENLGNSESDFKIDLITEMAKRLAEAFPAGFPLSPNELDWNEEETREYVQWQKVYERVADIYEMMRNQRSGNYSSIPLRNLASTGSRGRGSHVRQARFVMTPQLQQALRVLQLSRTELDELVLKELQENPALEEASTGEAAESEEQLQPNVPADPRERTPEPAVNRESSAVEKIGTLDWDEYLNTHANAIHGPLGAEAIVDDSDSDCFVENPLTKKTSLEDHLLWQVRLSKMSEKESAIAFSIIRNLDPNGYLGVTLQEICNATDSTPQEAETVLKRIQFFDPVGVAARDLRECLLIELENLQLGKSLAARIVADHLSFFVSKHYEKLATALGVTVDAIAEAAHVIASLEPKPSRGFEQDEVRTVLPDVFVEKVGDEYLIYLNDDGVPRLRVSSLYRRMAAQEGAADQQEREYLQEKVRAATWLIKSIQQRQQTLFRVTQSIFKLQRQFLEHGVSYIKPMSLRDVAEDIDMHQSTVSRATANKYVHTPQGLFDLKFFFRGNVTIDNCADGSMPKHGEHKSANLVCSFCGKSQDEVRKLIAGPTVYICDECIDLCNEIIAEECEHDESSANYQQTIEDEICASIATDGRGKLCLDRDAEREKIMELNPETKAALDAWLVAVSNWESPCPYDEARFYKFVDEYQKDHGFSIDEAGLLEQIRRVALARNWSLEDHQEEFFGIKAGLRGRTTATS